MKCLKTARHAITSALLIHGVASLTLDYSSCQSSLCHFLYQQKRIGTTIPQVPIHTRRANFRSDVFCIAGMTHNQYYPKSSQTALYDSSTKEDGTTNKAWSKALTNFAIGARYVHNNYVELYARIMSLTFMIYFLLKASSWYWISHTKIGRIWAVRFIVTALHLETLGPVFQWTALFPLLIGATISIASWGLLLPNLLVVAAFFSPKLLLHTTTTTKGGSIMLPTSLRTGMMTLYQTAFHYVLSPFTNFAELCKNFPVDKLMVVWVPVLEELYYRQIMLNLLKPKASDVDLSSNRQNVDSKGRAPNGAATHGTLNGSFSWWAITSSFVFAGAHISNWISPLARALRASKDGAVRLILANHFIGMGFAQSVAAFLGSVTVMTPLFEEYGLMAAIGGHITWNVYHVMLVFPIRLCCLGANRLRAMALSRARSVKQ